MTASMPIAASGAVSEKNYRSGPAITSGGTTLKLEDRGAGNAAKLEKKIMTESEMAEAIKSMADSLEAIANTLAILVELAAKEVDDGHSS